MTLRDNLLLLFMCIALISIIVLNAMMTHEALNTQIYLKEVIGDIASYKLYDPENYDKTTKVGVYFSKGYYCVRTDEQTLEQVKDTDYHEMCHAFVRMDRGHFCNGSNQTVWDVKPYLNNVTK